MRISLCHHLIFATVVTNELFISASSFITPLHRTQKSTPRTTVATFLKDRKQEEQIPVNEDGDNNGKKENMARGHRDPHLPIHKSIQKPGGLLCDEGWCVEDDLTHLLSHPGTSSSRKRVLVLCTGGTLTMSNDPSQGNSLAPVQGALTSYLEGMCELTDDPEMPEVVAHEYSPLVDSSDMGPGDWALLARDIETNYYHFDGFVVLMGTDTM